MQPVFDRTAAVQKRLLWVAPNEIDRFSKTKQAIVSHECAEKGYEFGIPRYDIGTGQFSHEEMLRDFNSATLILADLSFERPSCYYEIGFAEALGKPVSIVAEFGTIIHQTSHKAAIVFFSDIPSFHSVVSNLLTRHISYGE